ncbi:MAG: leucine-rich repeat domain-containing protein [Deltaproteobacteria bacterium]|nr:leucine-rich repeat domain-containing protein [Deltaproteobacteria bacterium]
MHFRKSIFILSLIYCMFLCSPAFAAQWGNFTYGFASSDNSTVEITGYTGLGGAVVIPDNITGLPVVTIGPSAFENGVSITSVTIPNSVTKIEYYAFRYCSGLTSVTIPASVTYIGAEAFRSCSLIAAYFLGNAPVMGQGVFVVNASGFVVCYTLGSTGFSNPWCPYWDDFPEPGGYDEGECYTAGIQSGDFVFDADNGKVRIVKYIGSGGAVVIPDTIEGMPVNSIGGGTTNGSAFVPPQPWSAFLGCDGLTNVTIPNSVTGIGDYAFNGCTGLTSVSIPGSVTSIGKQVFQNCTGLISATISDGVTTIASGMFDNCTGLTIVTIPGTVTSIGASAFFGCTGLSSVSIPASVTSIGGHAFAGCSGLTGIQVDAGNTAYSSQDGVLFSKDKTALIQYPSGKNDVEFIIPEGVTSIGDGAFYQCNGLISVTIPDSVTSMYGKVFKCVGICRPSDMWPPGSCPILDYSCSTANYGSFYDCRDLTGAYFEGNRPNITYSTYCSFPYSYCEEYGPFNICASGFTVYYRAGAQGFTNPWCFYNKGQCYPTQVYGESPATTTTTTTTVPAESCTVEIFPRRLSKVISTFTQLQALVLRGDENAAFSQATTINWGTDTVKTMLKAALGKKLIIALVFVQGRNQTVGDIYEVIVDNCTAELPVALF